MLWPWEQYINRFLGCYKLSGVYIDTFIFTPVKIVKVVPFSGWRYIKGKRVRISRVEV